jgi:hypothetical protein
MKFRRPCTYLLLLSLWGLIGTGPTAIGAEIKRFEAAVRAFAAIPDRTTGTAGNAAAVALIRQNLAEMGLKPAAEQVFSVPTRQYGPARLTFSRQGGSCPLYPFNGNAISPNTTPPQGLDGPLIYVGTGAYREMNGKPIKNAVVIMEMTSGRNWLSAAALGAKALIYVDRGGTSGALFREKVELSPIAFPRYWLPLETARRHLGRFEQVESGILDPAVRLTAPAQWEASLGRNLFVLIPGQDPELKDELVIVEAFYDVHAAIPGLAPGADESCGIATLLSVAEHLKQHPPGRSVLLAATGGHAQTLAGMRELVWSLAEKSKALKAQEQALKDDIELQESVLNALDDARQAMLDGDDGLDMRSDSPAITALQDRIKTELDTLSRQLMRVRMASRGPEQQGEIQQLAAQRRVLRQLSWASEYRDLAPKDRAVVEGLLPLARADVLEIMTAAQRQLDIVQSARKIRRLIDPYTPQALVSLHLSSHGDGVGAFNQGWLYPLKTTVNRVSPYAQINDVLEAAGKAMDPTPLAGMFQDTLRPSEKRPWQTYLPDQPKLGGEVSALAGFLGLTLATTHDMRWRWGTPYDTPDSVDLVYAHRQAQLVGALIARLAGAPLLTTGNKSRNGFATVTGRANFLRQGELFADQPAPGSVIMAYQGQSLYYDMVDPMGRFRFHGVADKKHVLQSLIIEGYRFDDQSGAVQWAIDKKLTGKTAYRLKIQRRQMETDLVMFSCRETTLFNLLEPRTFNYMTKINLIDARREASPLRYWYSRIDTRASVITSTYLEPGTRLKLTLSDTVLRKKLILLNATEQSPQGTGYHVQQYPMLHNTTYLVARDMWALLKPRIENLERHGIFNQRIRQLQLQGESAMARAADALGRMQYDRFEDAASRAWALASRVYDDVEQTQKDVLFGVLFYIALFVPFSFCMERLLFSYRSIYKRIIAFGVILLLLIAVIYHFHPAFQLAYSPTIVILAFFIMGLSLLVTLIIFLRFEDEMRSLQRRSRTMQSSELSHWKAFVAAFLLGVSNLRRRRLRTALTCLTLIILTFTIMSFTSVKSSRQYSRLLYQPQAPYHGFLLKHVNWQSLPPEALGKLTNAFSRDGWVAPRVWLEGDDRTRAVPIPLIHKGSRFDGFGLVGLGAQEGRVSGLDTILVQGRWLAPGALDEMLIPDRMALALGIELGPGDEAPVLLWGQPYRVVGVFSGEDLQQRVDLDGEPITPVTFPRETTTALTEVEMEALESGEDVQAFQSRYDHIAGNRTLIMPYRTLLAAGGQLKGVAVKVKMEVDQSKMAADLVDRFGLALFSGEPEGTFLYHAGDIMSYSGAPNIVIPLVISVFIVLNTMIGSVYERKREIAIYTSVGLAPSHVAFLFIAEALAFAVISVVLGYLVAQTSAGLLAGTALWAGITVNYSSLSGVAAMALVILVVLISVLYPARTASQIAIPDVNRSWKLPEAQGNQLALTLPFLMKHHEYASVGGFLNDFFQSHLNVSHGVFSTGDIQLQTAGHPVDAEGHTPPTDSILKLSSRVWLAPFDLGIMQEVVLDFSPVADEGGFLEVRVLLKRQSGEINAWHRINKAFLHHLRRQLLIWRSLDDAEKEHYQAVLEAIIKGHQHENGGS